MPTPEEMTPAVSAPEQPQMVENPIPITIPERTKSWKDAPLLDRKLDPKKVAKIQSAIYENFRDFGNMSKDEKYNSIYQLLRAKTKKIEEVDEDTRNSYIKTLLKDMGEYETYSISEGIYDVAGPAIGSGIGFLGGSAVGGPVGGTVGAISGSAIGAGVSEVLKANFERHKRGIPPMNTDEMVQMGLPVAVADAVFSMGGPLLARLKLGAARKILLPGGPFRGSMSNLPQEIFTTQDILGSVPVKRKSIYAALTDRFRYGKGGARASLNLEQLNEAEQNFVHTLSKMTGDSILGGPVAMRKRKEAFQVANDSASRLIKRISDDAGPAEAGRVVEDFVTGNLDLSAALRDVHWADARGAVQAQGIDVPMKPIKEFIKEEAGQLRRVKEMENLEDQILSHLTTHYRRQGLIKSNQHITEIPDVMKAEDALDLWNLLNSWKGNPDFGKAAGHLGPELYKHTSRIIRMQSPKASELVEQARNFHIGHQKRFNNKVIKGMLNSLQDTPEAIESFILSGNKTKESKLRLLKEAMPPGPFKQKVMPIMRYSFFDGLIRQHKDFGKVIDGKSIVKKLESFGATIENGKVVRSGEYLDTLFNGREGVQNVYDVAAAIDTSLTGHTGSTILVKLIEAGAFARATAPKVESNRFGALSLFISPVLLSSTVFTNNRLARELTNGVMGHKPVEQSILTILRIFEDSKREFTKQQMGYISNFIDKKMQQGQQDLQ